MSNDRLKHERDSSHFGQLPATLVETTTPLAGFPAHTSVETMLRTIFDHAVALASKPHKVQGFSVNASLHATVLGTFTLSARKAFTVFKTVTLDSRFSPGGVVRIDSVLRRSSSASWTLDSVLRKGRSAMFTIDAALARPFGAFTVNAALRATQLRNFTLDAFIRPTGSGSTAVPGNAILGDMVLGQP